MFDTMTVPLSIGQRVEVDPGRSVGVTGPSYFGRYDGAHVLPTGQVLAVVVLDKTQTLGDTGCYTDMSLADMSSVFPLSDSDAALADLRKALCG